MGFSTWPYDATIDAVLDTYAKADLHGDILSQHVMGGVPWPEAFAGDPYHPSVEADIAGKADTTPDGIEVVLAADALNSGRNGLALYWGATTEMPHPAPWDTRDFNSPEVIQAYSNFALDLIGRFDPAYFNYGVEASDLILSNFDAWTRFLVFAAGVSANIKTVHPDLPLMVSAALKHPGSSEMAALIDRFPDVLPYVDVVGISVSPYVFFGHSDAGDPANLPEAWLSQAVALAGEKPMAVTETGWLAEDMDIPSLSLDVDGSTAWQDDYARALLNESNTLGLEFVTQFTVVDYDLLWSGVLGEAPLARVWRDTGVYADVATARRVLTTWDA